ncbi:hypothetical protein Y695_03819 [Hydrogenophaga sp. T4]|nr:hypothetical protein Y695_03819 [Hydrogenophaga sp. T4]
MSSATIARSSGWMRARYSASDGIRLPGPARCCERAAQKSSAAGSPHRPPSCPAGPALRPAPASPCSPATPLRPGCARSRPGWWQTAGGCGHCGRARRAHRARCAPCCRPCAQSAWPSGNHCVAPPAARRTAPRCAPGRPAGSSAPSSCPAVPRAGSPGSRTGGRSPAASACPVAKKWPCPGTAARRTCATARPARAAPAGPLSAPWCRAGCR